MSKKKIMLVFGTRPEAIKMAPIVRALLVDVSNPTVLLCVTGQHRAMLDQVLELFEINPDIDLDLMREGQKLGDITAGIIIKLQAIYETHRPDVVLVHGDTTTSLAAAMAAFYAGIPVGHIEAGLRTHDLSAPFPEEFNRQMVTKIARWHFAPTISCRNNLLAERVPASHITVTGNSVIDALFFILERIKRDAVREARLTQLLNQCLPFNWKETKFVLVTGHRRENFGEGLLQICDAIYEVATKFSEVHFVYPVHLNPKVRAPVKQVLSDLPNVHLIEPLEYERFVFLLSHSHIVLTDSGGLQEEAPSLGKPVLIMRELTERSEGVEAGTAELVGTERALIIESLSQLLIDEEYYQSMSLAHNPYGDGQASHRILTVLRDL